MLLDPNTIFTPEQLGMPGASGVQTAGMQQQLQQTAAMQANAVPWQHQQAINMPGQGQEQGQQVIQQAANS